eukprot:COSAG06_NODE_47142_length_341_cov_0.859504_2_plen_24_part_01
MGGRGDAKHYSGVLDLGIPDQLIA